MPDRPLLCPWQNAPTHRRNGEIQVHADRPLIGGQCPVRPDCAFCAGTEFKPNTAIELGRSFTFLPCPYCRPEDYRIAVAARRASGR